MITSAAGLVVGLAVSAALGALLPVDPSLPGIAARTEVGLADLGLAVAAGAAGTLAFTAGTAEAVIGVMVAVALVPPLVTGGLLLGAGRPELALGGLVLTVTNLVGLNLSSVATFLVHGLRPTRWWEAERAKKATRIALIIWTALSLLPAAPGPRRIARPYRSWRPGVTPRSPTPPAPGWWPRSSRAPGRPTSRSPRPIPTWRRDPRGATVHSSDSAPGSITGSNPGTPSRTPSTARWSSAPAGGAGRISGSGGFADLG